MYSEQYIKSILNQVINLSSFSRNGPILYLIGKGSLAF